MGTTTSNTGAQTLPPAAQNLPHSLSPAKPTPTPDEAPAGPLVVIEPRKSWRPVDFTELWAYRELLYFLIWRDVKVRYKQTLLGASWVILQPLFTMVVFSLIFGRLAGIDSEGVPYPLFAFAGLLPWTFFAAAINSGGNSLVGSAHLITKVYFPRLIVPLATVAAYLVDFLLSFLVLLVLLVYYRVAPGWGLLLLPLLVAQTVVLAFSVSLLLSALNVKYRDIRQVLPFLAQMWMFASPVIYPAALVRGRWRLLLTLNPMTGIIEAFRAALFGRAPDWAGLGLSAAITLALLLVASVWFRRMERGFADIV